MLHVIDKADGHIIEQCPEGSDVSRFDPADFEVVSGADRIDHREAYHYLDGQPLLKPVVSLAADKLAITGDGQDQAAVSVAVTGADPLPGSIDIAVGGSSETVTLAGGQGRLSAITAEAPGEIEVRAVDAATYFDQGGITIGARD